MPEIFKNKAIQRMKLKEWFGGFKKKLKVK